MRGAFDKLKKSRHFSCVGQLLGMEQTVRRAGPMIALWLLAGMPGCSEGPQPLASRSLAATTTFEDFESGDWSAFPWQRDA